MIADATTRSWLVIACHREHYNARRVRLGKSNDYSSSPSPSSGEREGLGDIRRCLKEGKERKGKKGADR